MNGYSQHIRKPSGCAVYTGSTGMGREGSGRWPGEAALYSRHGRMKGDKDCGYRNGKEG